MSVSIQDFIAWKNDPVTKLVFKDLSHAKDVCLERMTSPEHLDNPNGLLYLNRLRGYVNAIDEFINLQAENFIEEQDSETGEAVRI